MAIIYETDNNLFEHQLPEKNIKIYNDLGKEVAKSLAKNFLDEDVVIVNNNFPGGGGDGSPIFPLCFYTLFIGLSVFAVVGKGFFDELGRGLAKKVLSILFDKEKTTEIHLIYEQGAKEFLILIPSKTSIEHLTCLEISIKKLKESGRYVYSKDLKDLIKID